MKTAKVLMPVILASMAVVGILFFPEKSQAQYRGGTSYGHAYSGHGYYNGGHYGYSFYPQYSYGYGGYYPGYSYSYPSYEYATPSYAYAEPTAYSYREPWYQEGKYFPAGYYAKFYGTWYRQGYGYEYGSPTPPPAPPKPQPPTDGPPGQFNPPRGEPIQAPREGVQQLQPPTEQELQRLKAMLEMLEKIRSK